MQWGEQMKPANRLCIAQLLRTPTMFIISVANNDQVQLTRIVLWRCLGYSIDLIFPNLHETTEQVVNSNIAQRSAERHHSVLYILINSFTSDC